MHNLWDNTAITLRYDILYTLAPEFIRHMDYHNIDKVALLNHMIAGTEPGYINLGFDVLSNEGIMIGRQEWLPYQLWKR